jgi:predicted RNA binding protein YcfA (HicA-like mRNA interferase family)
VAVTERQLVALIERDGWKLDRVRGSHHTYVHPTKPGIVVIARHRKGRDIPLGLLLAVLKEAGLR